MENIKIDLGKSAINVYDIKLFNGTFIITLLFGLKDSSSFYYNKLQNFEGAISIYWFDGQIFLSPKNIKFQLTDYSIVMTFKIGDIM